MNDPLTITTLLKFSGLLAGVRDAPNLSLLPFQRACSLLLVVDGVDLIGALASKDVFGVHFDLDILIKRVIVAHIFLNLSLYSNSNHTTNY